MKTKAKDGIVYAATGSYFVGEAIKSYHTLRKNNPEIPVVIYTDAHNEEMAESVFDSVILLKDPNYNFIDKIAPLLESPFDRSIFLDTDTYVVGHLSPFFELLGRYDFCAAFAPGRDEFQDQSIPDFFPEFNTGVIGFNKSENAMSAIRDWLQIYSDQIKSGQNPPHDQPSFRQALYYSAAKVYCMPHEYNFRTTIQNVVPGGSRVSVLHGRNCDFDDLSARLNRPNLSPKITFHEPRFLKFDSINFVQKSSHLLLFPLKVCLEITGLLFRLLNRFYIKNDWKKVRGN